MRRETSTSNGSVHNYYEHFINSYKTLIAVFSCLHLARTSSIRERLISARVSVYVAVRSMDGVQDYYAKD